MREIKAAPRRGKPVCGLCDYARTAVQLTGTFTAMQCSAVPDFADQVIVCCVTSAKGISTTGTWSFFEIYQPAEGRVLDSNGREARLAVLERILSVQDISSVWDCS